MCIRDRHKIALWKSIQHIYETPEILRSLILSTVSCPQSDNDVSTSNTLDPIFFVNVVLVYIESSSIDTIQILVLVSSSTSAT